MLGLRFELEPSEPGTGASSATRLVTIGALAALATALLVAGGALSAGSSASSTTITACVKKSSGAARIVSSGSKCRSTERRVTWKRIGPAGKQGLAGAQGATGAQGVQGATGANGAPGQPGIDDFNDLEGMPCTRGGDPGSVDLVFGPGGVARTRCVLPSDGPVCGDGVTEGGEACDDGNGNPTDGCTNTCQVAICGDGVARQGVEQCDTSGQTDVCDANCTTAYCGDGTTNSNRGEQCDVAGGGFTAACDNDCTAAMCGDGLTNPASEECDDGNQVDTDECTNACLFAP
jgi:cysteine-rich repeat protein